MCIRDRVCFMEAYDRDVVMSHASSLKGECSIAAVIPEHLTPLHRHLESYAYKIRKNGRNGGKRISTSIRLQDDGMTLALALKAEGETRWNYFSKEELKTNNERVLREEEESRKRRGRRKREEEEQDLGTDSELEDDQMDDCLLYTSPSPRD